MGLTNCTVVLKMSQILEGLVSYKKKAMYFFTDCSPFTFILQNKTQNSHQSIATSSNLTPSKLGLDLLF